MNRRLQILFACVMTLVMAGSLMVDSAKAQVLRSENTFFLKPRVGLAQYIGDYHPEFDLETNSERDGLDGFPWALAVELGYQWTNLSLSGGYQIANYPSINGTDALGAFADPLAYSRRHTGSLLLRYLFTRGRVAPYITLGGHITSGETTESFSFDGIAYGPLAGLGLDIALTDRASFTIDLISHFAFPDGDVPTAVGQRPRGSGVDGLDAENNVPAGVEDFADFDLLNFAGFGLKYNFRSAVIPVEVLAVDCPTTLEVGEAGTFTANVNDPTPPVEYRWTFGDGATATGLLATHSYATPGTYEVTFLASNRGATISRTCTVVVEAAPIAPEIVTLAAEPSTFQVCEPVTVTFTSNVRGDAPIDYVWRFEDGTTAQGPTATRTYTQPGTYTVTLTVTSPSGTDTRTITVNALECEVGICDEITELNAVYFDRNESILTAEARAALQENLEILRECPNICVRILACAAQGERNPQALSEARAQAVAQYYMDNGIAASRLVTVGQGVCGGGKKGGGAQFRVAESIPVPCDQLGF